MELPPTGLTIKRVCLQDAGIAVTKEDGEPVFISMGGMRAQIPDEILEELVWVFNTRRYELLR